MRPGDLVLAIDLGTSEVKVAAFSLDGRRVGRASSPVALRLGEGGAAEQDPSAWWRAVTSATRELLAARSDDRPLGAVVCTGQWAGTVAVDAGGEPLAPALTWLDSRGAPQARAVTRGFPTVAGYSAWRLFHWVRLSGGVPTHSGKDPVSHILWLKENRPGIYRAARWFLEPKDWLNFRLTGLARATQDSIALHWVTDNRDLTRVDYHPRLLAWTGIDREKLPDLVRSTDLLGPLLPGPAAELGLPAGIPVVAGTPDMQAAALGSGAVRTWSGHLSIGTSTWLTCHVPFLKTDVFHSLTSLPSADPSRYLVIDEQATSGGALRHLVENLLFPDDPIGSDSTRRPADVYARLDAAAAGVPAGADGLLFTPWLYGERTPVDDSTLCGGFHGMSLRTTRAHLVRAVLEGVALNARWLLGYVERFTGRPFPWLRVIGGGARSETWCRILADVLDRPILQVAEPTDACARGAALLATVATGHARFDDLEERVPITAEFRPDPTHRAVYAHRFERFLATWKAETRIRGRLGPGPGPIRPDGAGETGGQPGAV